MIIIEEILKTKENWQLCLEEHNKFVQKYIGDDDIAFTKKIKFKWYADNNEVNTLYITDFIVNLMMWRPFIKLKRELSNNMIFDCECITKKSIKNYIDNQVLLYDGNRTKYSNKLLNKESIKIIEALKTIVEDYGVIMANSINLKDINDLREISPEFDDLIHTRIPDGMQPSEIEQMLAVKGKRLVSILKENDNHLKPYLDSEEGIKINQLIEFMLNIGPKPDLDGNTYPIPVNTNLLVHGLDTPVNYYLDATGGRKAVIMNKLFTGNSGYFARKLNLLTSDLALHPDPNYDCGTTNLLEYTIMDEYDLQMHVGRYFKSRLNAMYLQPIKPTDTYLIGRKIYLRSPSKCAGARICRKCYGELYGINADINVGFIASTEMTRQFIQNILSAKHLLKTNSEKISLLGRFDDFFMLDGNTILLNQLEDVNKYYLQLDLESEGMISDDFDVLNFGKSVKSIKIVEGASKNVVTIIQEEDECEFLLSEYLDGLVNKYSKSDNRYVNIPISKIEVSEVLFMIMVVNNELTKPLNEVKNILDKTDSVYDTIEEMVQVFNRKLKESKIFLHSTHAEVIIKNMIRKPNNLLKMTDFSKPNPNYTIIPVSRALKLHPSIVISLAYERLLGQFKNPLTFKKRATSTLDPLFRV